MMEEGLRRLYTGDFNAMMTEEQPDGSVVITLSKDGDDNDYRFKVRDLYGENEKVLKHEVVLRKAPQFVIDRMKKAKKEKEEIERK